MKIIELIRLILKHLRLLLIVPILLVLLVIILTRKNNLEYSSQTILYTGLASGSSIEMDKAFNYYATSTAFDNLINIISSRDTQEEVAIRLLAQHLMLTKANTKYISHANFEKFKLKIPANIYNYVEKGAGQSNSKDSIYTDKKNLSLFPPQINRSNYEKTVKNLTALMKSSNTNFVYELLNYEDEHYSIKAIGTVNAIRIANSDMLKLSYTVNDPGICQQTLAIYNDVCIKNYKHIKENRSDAVVKYFEQQLTNANEKLKSAEDKLLEFNKSYNIINYYEQSKAVAVVKEDMEVGFNNKKAKLAGIQAGTKKLEEKLNIQDQIQQKNNILLDKKKQLGDLNFEIALAQAEKDLKNDQKSIQRVAALTKQSETLIKEISKSVNDLYTYQNTIEGVPVSKVLPDWMNNIVESENLKAEITVMDQRNKDFQNQYAIYAPAGANIKRIEREISVSEQGYLEILHGLNLAKLKLQDNELSTNLKAIDPPFYPLTPMPTKRKILIIAAAFLGGILTLAILLVMDFFDDTLKNSILASKKIGLASLGMIPKMILNAQSINLPFIQKRLIEIITQNILQFFDTNASEKISKTIVVLSTQKLEGKTVLAGNIAKTLKQEGKKVLLLNYKHNQGYAVEQRKFSIINKILGYPDPRIDLENPFLADVSTYLDTSEYHTYAINNQFYNAKGFEDIIKQNNIYLDYIPDVVIIELPALIFNNYPAELITQADLGILVCRSNRVWAEADQTAIKNLLEANASKIKLIINGVSINEVESILGELPKQRTEFRKKVKALFKFQFFTKNQI